MKILKIFLLLSFLFINKGFSQKASNDNCVNATVFCGNGTLTYPATTGTPSAEPGPFYGCLLTQPNPAWFFMQIGDPGRIVIKIIDLKSGIEPPDSNDVDFICWGPFTSPTGACTEGLTSSKVVDCSYSPYALEYCQIQNAISGDFYLLMITNYANDPGFISFYQSNYGMPGAGNTNCNIVTNCSILSLSPVATECDLGSGTFAVNGTIEFTNPPTATGSTLTITDITATPNIVLTFNPPFISPMDYTIPNIPCDGLTHQIFATFPTAGNPCTLTAPVSIPAPCPTATITGNGPICKDGNTPYYAGIITFTGAALPPYDFTYSIDDLLDFPVINYNGPFPYQVPYTFDGIYTVASVSSPGCPSGIVSGSVDVYLMDTPDPPVPSSVSFSRCGAGSIALSVVNNPGMTTKWYDAPSGGNLLYTGNPYSPSIAVTTVYYAEAVTAIGPCWSLTRTPITAVIKPVPSISNTTTAEGICSGGSPTISITSTPTGASFTWIATNPDGRVNNYTPTGGGDLNMEVLNINPGVFQPGVVNYSVTPTIASCPGNTTPFTITVNPIPTVNTVANQVVCNNELTSLVSFGGSVNNTQYNWTNSNTSIGLTASGSGDIPAFLGTNTGINPVTANITVTPAYTNAGITCTGAFTSFTITVNPIPTINPVANQVVCHNELTSLISFLGTVPGTLYNWTNSNTSIGLVANGSGDIPAFTATNAGSNPITATITVTPVYTYSGKMCTGTSTSFIITVNPLPTVNTVANQTVCSNTLTNPILFSGSIPGTQYNWINSDPSIGLGVSGSGNISAFTATNITNNPITATITVSTSFTNLGKTCLGTNTSFTISVNPLPGSATTITGPAVVCQGQTGATYSSAIITAATEYVWNYTGTGASVATNTQDILIDYSVTATSGNWTVFGRNSCGVGSSAFYPVFVNPKPNATFRVCTPLKTIRNGRKIQLKGGYPLPGTYLGEGVSLIPTTTDQYQFDPSVVSGPFPKNVIITYQYKNSFSCQDEKPQTITVFGTNADITGPSAMKDLRNDALYSYATFGTGPSAKAWMTQNLNYGFPVTATQPQTDNCIAEKYCPPSNPTCSGTGGGYYQWDELMEYQAGEGYQDLCPPGWHVPTETEWQTLIDNVNPSYTAPISNAIIGSELKDPVMSFKALLEGISYLNNNWSFTGGMTATMFWTSTTDGNGKVIARGLNNPYNKSISKYASSPANAFPVRCAKN